VLDWLNSREYASYSSGFSSRSGRDTHPLRARVIKSTLHSGTGTRLGRTGGEIDVWGGGPGGGEYIGLVVVSIVQSVLGLRVERRGCVNHGIHKGRTILLNKGPLSVINSFTYNFKRQTTGATEDEL
jgi:hypothetical protein